jgi:LPS sulfotransferase NodH
VGRRKLSGAPSYGYHVKIYQLEDRHETDPARHIRRAYANDWRIVYLKRTNLLRQALSNIRANATGTYHHSSRSDDSEDSFSGLEVTPSNLLEMMKSREANLAQEQEILSDLPHLEITYERDLMEAEQHQETAEKVFDFLGLEAEGIQVSTELERINRGSLSELICNYGEVASELKGTPYARFLK